MFDPAHSQAPVLRLRPLILSPTPAYGATKHNQSANLYRNYRDWKRDGCFLPLISFPAMFLVLSKKHLVFWWNLQIVWGYFTLYIVNYFTVQDYFHYWDWQCFLPEQSHGFRAQLPHGYETASTILAPYSDIRIRRHLQFWGRFFGWGVLATCIFQILIRNHWIFAGWVANPWNWYSSKEVSSLQMLLSH